MGLTQVEVREGDAYDTGLPRASFDGAHMRLVLVNVPKPEVIVREMIALVRPGGWVASFEADVFSRVIDPPSRRSSFSIRTGSTTRCCAWSAKSTKPAS